MPNRKSKTSRPVGPPENEDLTPSPIDLRREGPVSSHPFAGTPSQLKPGTFNSIEPSENQALWYWRRLFIEAIRKWRPEVLESLRDDVAPHFAAWRDGEDVPEIWYVRKATETFRHLVPFRDALFAWAERWRLGEKWWAVQEDWILQGALDTLRFWRRSPEWAATLAWSHDDRTPDYVLSDDERRFHLTLDGWHPELGETVAEALRRVARQATRKAREDYVPARIAMLHERGWRESPGKRTRKHVEWLVRFHINDESLSKIASTVHTFKENVSQRIHEVATLIGLTLRAPLPGIKKKANR